MVEQFYAGRQKIFLPLSTVLLFVGPLIIFFGSGIIGGSIDLLVIAWAGLLLRVPHLMCTIWLAYFFAPVRERMGPQDFSRYLVWRALILLLAVLLFFVTVLYFGGKFGVLLVLAASVIGPLAWHHTAAQDKGLLLGEPINDSRSIAVGRRVYFIRLSLEGLFWSTVIVGWIYGDHLLQIRFFPTLFAVVLICGTVAAFLFGAKTLFQKTYYFSLVSQDGARWFASFMGGLSATPLFHGIRHNFVYIDLTNKAVQRGSSTALQKVGFWLFVILCSTALIWLSKDVPLMGVQEFRLEPAVGFSSIFSMALISALNVHHYYLDRYLWNHKHAGLARWLREAAPQNSPSSALQTSLQHK